MKKGIKNVLGPKIKFYREVAGISQDNLAYLLAKYGVQVDRTIISKIEHQARVIYDYEIIAIAKALGISYNDLFKK